MKKIFLLLFIPILSCSNEQNQKPVELKYPEDSILTWNQAFTIKDSDYYLYFYSETCGHCIRLKQEVLTFYYKGNFNCYFVNCTNYGVFKEDSSKIIGIHNIYDLYIIGTPTILRIEKSTVSEYYGGEEAIRNLMKNK